jgi:hypothetical protein
VKADLPFAVDQMTERAVNAENQLNCFFIENPTTKSMEKSIIIKVGPEQTRELLAIVQAPHKVQKAKMVAKIKVHHLVDG